MSDPYTQVYVKGYEDEDGCPVTRLEYLKLWARKKGLDQMSTKQGIVSANAENTQQCRTWSVKNLTVKAMKNKLDKSMQKRERSIKMEERSGELPSGSASTDNEVHSQAESGSMLGSGLDIKPIDLESGKELEPIGSKGIQPTDLSQKLEILRQDVSHSMTLVDSTARDLYSVMQKVIKPLSDEDDIPASNLDRVKIACGCAREIKELIKIKVDAMRVAKDMLNG